MKQMMKLAVTLAAYTVTACIALAAVYKFTKPVIEQVKVEKTNRALQAVFPDADDFKEITGDIAASFEKIKFLNAYQALKDGEVSGLTITASGSTYDKATILIAVNLDGTIKQINFLELTDTPGLGSKAAEEPFKGQFNGKQLRSSFAVGDDVNAIGGATITSRGVSALVKAGADEILSYAEKNGITLGGR